MKNLLECDGRVFTANYRGDPVIGRIKTTPDNHVILVTTSGSEIITDGTKENLEFCKVEDFQLCNHTEVSNYDNSLKGYEGYCYCAIIGCDDKKFFLIGRIQKEHGMHYLCQDELNGVSCDDRLGYYYSWIKPDSLMVSDDISSFILLEPFPIEGGKTEDLDLLKEKGSFFSCRIYGKEVTGRVQVEDGKVFLCQNVSLGCQCSDTLGYNYSWSISYGTTEDMIRNDVSDFKLFTLDFLKDNMFEKFEETDDINLLDKDGASFTATIQGDICEGKISVEDNEVYLCQNVADGLDCHDKKGYKYSWSICKGTKLAIFNCDVTNFTLITKNGNDDFIFDFSNHGKYFVAFINSDLVKGRISIECGNAFLCQDLRDGAIAKEKFGYKYSWIINNGEVPCLEGITNLQIFPNLEECIKVYEELKDPVEAILQETCVIDSSKVTVMHLSESPAMSSMVAAEHCAKPLTLLSEELGNISKITKNSKTKKLFNI